jgi:hypothetical protein
MRKIWTSILTTALSAVVTTSFAAPPQEPPSPPRQDGAQRSPLNERQLQEVGRMNPDEAHSLVALFFSGLRPRSLDSNNQIAGLPAASRPELLTWERVYALALVHARAGSTTRADVLDPKGLAELAAQHGVADFDRFRHDFLAGRSGAAASTPFRDPSSDYLELLRRLQVIGNASYDVALRENYLRLYQELLRGEASGLSQLEVDQVDASLVNSRGRLTHAIARYRDGLDEFKAAIGFSPRAPLIPDAQGIAAFREGCERVHNWHRDPNRRLDTLPKLVARFPALGDVAVDGQPILATIEQNPDRLEALLAAATQMAGKHRSSPEKGEPAVATGAQLELHVRRHIRNLAETRHVYDAEKRRIELGNRLIDQLLEQFVAPPAGATHALAQAVGARIQTQRLLDELVQIQKSQDSLVGLWASFKAERLTLYRDLGILPYDNWKAFYDDLTAPLDPIKQEPSRH